MLNLEQITIFQNAVTKAKKVIVGSGEDARKNGDIKYHIRVSGRQTAGGAWCVGLIFGTKGNEDWLKIADVPEADMAKAKTIYRAMLHDLIHVK
ncbi:hypothetical protein EU642_22320 [Salmonella enterica]|nr:hypothetical protein [Salmonella enterica]EAO0118590.1 hypothetical protein [Salmonella enterica]EAO3601693.1 hypothetical protein [Salmonella enterica]EAR6391588.1 hypothetical protein [Salmonella enterica]EAV1285352.1 hypothetical protein [Salmonella enterica]